MAEETSNEVNEDASTPIVDVNIKVDDALPYPESDGVFDYSSSDSEYSEPPEALLLSDLSELELMQNGPSSADATVYDEADDDRSDEASESDPDALWIAANLVERVNVHDPENSNWALQEHILTELRNMGLDVSTETGIGAELDKRFADHMHELNGEIYIAYVELALRLKHIITSVYSNKEQLTEEWIFVRWGSQSGWFNVITGQAWESSMKEIGTGLKNIYDPNENEHVMTESRILNHRVDESQKEKERLRAMITVTNDKHAEVNVSRVANTKTLKELQQELETTKKEKVKLHAQLEQRMQMLEHETIHEQPVVLLTKECDELATKLSDTRKELSRLKSERKNNARIHASEMSHNQMVQLELTAELALLREEAASLRKENGALGWEVTQTSLSVIELSPYTKMNHKLVEQIETTKKIMRKQKRTIQFDLKEDMKLTKENEGYSAVLDPDDVGEVDLDDLEEYKEFQTKEHETLKEMLEATKRNLIQAEVTRKELQQEHDDVMTVTVLNKMTMQSKARKLEEFNNLSRQLHNTF